MDPRDLIIQSSWCSRIIVPGGEEARMSGSAPTSSLNPSMSANLEFEIDRPRGLWGGGGGRRGTYYYCHKRKTLSSKRQWRKIRGECGSPNGSCRSFATGRRTAAGDDVSVERRRGEVGWSREIGHSRQGSTGK